MQGGAQGQKPGSGRGRGRDREGENALGRAWEEMEKSTRQMQESLRGQVQGWTGLLLGRALHTGLLGATHTQRGLLTLPQGPKFTEDRAPGVSPSEMFLFLTQWLDLKKYLLLRSPRDSAEVSHGFSGVLPTWLQGSRDCKVEGSKFSLFLLVAFPCYIHSEVRRSMCKEK